MKHRSVIYGVLFTLAKYLQATTFFYKSHIFAGQVLPNGTSVVDFAWLTKEEIGTAVDGNYWNGVKDMLSDF